MPISKNASLRYKILDQCFSHQGRRFTFKELHERVNQMLSERDGTQVAERQLRDDLSHMRSSSGFDAPIIVDKTTKPPTYSYEDPDFSINNNPLNPKEAELLGETLKMLSRFDGSPRFAWIQELGPVLRSTFNIDLDKENVILSYEWNPDYEGFKHISGLFDAILHERVLRVSYQPYAKEGTNFLFHPYYLKQFNQRWFVIGYNEDLDFMGMNLALDRIVSFQETDIEYRQSETNWEEYFDDIIGVTLPENEACLEVKLNFAVDVKPYVLTKPLHQSQKAKILEDGCLEIRLKLIPNYELESVILSFGEKVEVISPSSLRDKVKNRAKELLRHYA